MISTSQSGPSRLAISSTTLSMMLTPRLIFGAQTIGISRAACRTRSPCSAERPVVPTTIAVPSDAASAACSAVASGEVNSSTTSLSRMTISAVSTIGIPIRPIPASSPMSWLTCPLPGASLPPATEQPSVAAISATSILPIRPPHPTTPILVPAMFCLPFCCAWNGYRLSGKTQAAAQGIVRDVLYRCRYDDAIFMISSRGGACMTKALSDRQIARYHRDGCLSPLPVFFRNEITGLFAKFSELQQREGGTISGRTNRKPHLLLPWLNEVIRHPKILDAVEDVIGPNILCWSSGFFAKAPRDVALVSWHQDSTYWGLSEPDVVTAWVAFTPSTVESGCMRVIPGSHQLDQIPHRDTFAKNNLLSRG